MKRTLIEILGGDMDGQTLDSASADSQEQLQVKMVLSMTKDGTVGHGFNGLSLSAVQALQSGEKTIQDFGPANARHSYTVTSRDEHDDRIVIRVRHEYRQEEGAMPEKTPEPKTCDFADGPFSELNIKIPLEGSPPRMRFLISQDGKPYEGPEPPAGFVEYEKRQDGDTWRFFHVVTDVSPPAAEAALQQLAAIRAANELSKYSIEQLAFEIASRENYASVVIYAAVDPERGDVPAGSDIAVVPSRFFKGPPGPAPLLQDALKRIAEDYPLPEVGPPTFEIDGIRTLPIYVCTGQTLEKIPAFSKGKFRFVYEDPDYDPPDYSLGSVGEQISNDPDAAIKAVKAWRDHLFKFIRFVQFKDDPSRKLIRALSDHTELVTTLCDARLAIDPTEIWQSFDTLMGFEAVHSDYRADEKRSSHYAQYAAKLEKAYDLHSAHSHQTSRLIDRIVKQIELKAPQWAGLPPIVTPSATTTTTTTTPPPDVPKGPFKLFYSYSHNDEEMRVELEKHLSLLQRNNVIEGWHFRKIPPGREWRGEIDENLEAAQIILLLMSADFLNSNYCWEVEARRAMERHNLKQATVIPVVVRACDWKNSLFEKLEALPTNAKPITSWSNRDEALYDVTQGIKHAIEAMREASK